MYRLMCALFLCGCVVESAKILAIFPSLGYSQYFVGEPLLVHLAERGHEITLISFYKPKPPVKNIKPIEVDGWKPYLEGNKFFFWQKRKSEIFCL